MACRRALPILAAAALAAALGCSKTQDTAPDPMRFGQPPVIEKVDFSVAEKSVECDLTEKVDAWLFQDGPFENYCDKAVIGGKVEDCYRSRRIATYRLGENVTQIVGVRYTELRIEATVSDPDSTLAQDNVLLATASFVLNSGQSGATEYSLILLDDGSKNQFDFLQKSGIPQGTCRDNCKTTTTTTCEDIFIFDPEPMCPSPGRLRLCDDPNNPTEETCHDCCEECPLDATNCTNCLSCNTEMTEVCEPICDPATFTLHTNDVTEGDHVFSRGFAFYDLKLPCATCQTLPGDCIANLQHQAPFTASGVQRLEFKIEAVDRQGNLVEWGERRTADIGENDLICTGDACFCCFLRKGGFTAQECQDLGVTGAVDPVNDPNGKCNLPNPTPTTTMAPSACPMACPP